jgi:hypothetical protein
MTLEQIRYARDEATTLDLKVHVGIGELELRATPDADDVLVDGSAELPEHFRLEHARERRGTRARVTIDVKADTKLRRNIKESPKVWLAVARDIPLSLVFDTGIGETELDLTDLNLANLDVKAGIGEFEVRLPRRGVFRATLMAGIGQLTVGVPVGLAASIQAKRTIGALDIDSRFAQQGDRWVSEDYANAEHRADITLKTSIGEARVESLGWD